MFFSSRFCEPLIDSGNARETLKDSPTGSVNPEEEAQTFKWKVSKYGKCAHMARKLFSIFIKEIVEGMIGYVRLPRIMLKLLSENGNQEFGDFKLTILGILGRYDFERRILVRFYILRCIMSSLVHLRIILLECPLLY